MYQVQCTLIFFLKNRINGLTERWYLEVFKRKELIRLYKVYLKNNFAKSSQNISKNKKEVFRYAWVIPAPIHSW